MLAEESLVAEVASRSIRSRPQHISVFGRAGEGRGTPNRDSPGQSMDRHPLEEIGVQKEVDDNAGGVSQGDGRHPAQMAEEGVDPPGLPHE